MNPGDVVDGRFTIEELAGSGGMGAVYRATDGATGERVAVKVLHAATASDVARFEREAKVLDLIKHPAIVRSIARGRTHGGAPYLVLEWLDGEDLARALKTRRPTQAEAVALAARIAAGLGRAHEGGVVHRDVKPANVFLVGGRFDQPRILDFGIARLVAATTAMTKTGTAMGTPSYMPPEQARGLRSVDARADVYAVGCVLYECITGEPPYDGEHVIAILARVLFDDTPRASHKVDRVPKALDDAIFSLMSKDPALRPRTGLEVERMLARLTLDGPVARRPRAGVETGGQITHREQKLLAAVAAMPARTPGATTAPRGDDAQTLAVGDTMSSAEIAEVIATFGGKFSPLADGSAILVLEGVGSAVDVALRAARCAIALFKARSGIEVAAAMGRGDADGKIPIGDVVDRVAALGKQGVVRRGVGDPAIRIDELLAGLLDDRFEIDRDASGLVLRGERPSDPGQRLVLGRPSPCVGRAREIGTIDAVFAECEEEPASRCVVLSGAPGLGKSRVRSEWLERLRRSDRQPTVWMGRADPLASGSALGAIASALRSGFGLLASDDLGISQARIRERVWAHAEDAEHAKRLAAFIGEIVGVAFDDADDVQLRAARRDPTLMGDQMQRSFEDVVLAEATARPLVLVLEDLQWGDSASVRFLESALRHAREAPFFALVVGRPEVTAQFPTLLTARGVTHLPIGELSKKAATELARALLSATTVDARGDEPTAASTIQEIVERAAGNAFFLEELVRCVADGQGTLPETVLAMLQARLGSLAPESRRVLRAASVFGNVFWPGAVEVLLGRDADGFSPTVAGTSPSARLPESAAATADVPARIELLIAEEFFERRRTSRFPREAELVFRHALVRDAAYAMLTPADLRAGHRLAGRWLEGAGEKDPRVLAEHFERGGKLDRASYHLMNAATSALEVHDFTAVVALTARAERAGLEDPVMVGKLKLLSAEAHRWRGDFVEAERAAEVAVQNLPRGTAPWFRAVDEAMTAAGRRGGQRHAASWREQLVDVPFEDAARGARLIAIASAGRRMFQGGDYESALDIVEVVDDELARWGEAAEPLAVAEVHRLRGARARHVGDVAGDLRGYQKALEATVAAGDHRNAANVRTSLGFAYIELGAFRAARKELGRALEESERLKIDTVRTRARQNLAWLLGQGGFFDEAIPMLEEVVVESRAAGNTRFEGWTHLYLSWVLRESGALQQGAERAARAAELLAETPPAYASALAGKALALASLGAADDADLAASEALEILRSYGGIEEFESLVWRAAIVSARAVGDPERADALEREGRARLDERAKAIDDDELRASFLGQVLDNARLVDPKTPPPWTKRR